MARRSPARVIGGRLLQAVPVILLATFIVFALLKRHGLVREYRGGSWERLQSRLTSVDLSADLTDYEQRRLQDRAKLRAMINYCQSAQCRTRYILDYFGEDVDAAWQCENCDACDGGLVVTRRRAEMVALA